MRLEITYGAYRDYINPADGRPIYQLIKCQVLALFSSADKKNNYLVIIFFHRPTDFGFWQSADSRPTIGRSSADRSADFIFE